VIRPLVVALAVLAGVVVLAVESAPAASAAEPVASRCEVVVRIPALDVREDLRYYRGSPDDGPGTRIQNRGDLASPLGPGGGTRAGELGNFFIAGHRTSAAAPLKHLRHLRPGDEVIVRTRCGDGFDQTHTYAVTRKARYIDFFTRKGRALQIAPVPFAPGTEATQPMITLSTCATQEDNARGDRRRDRYGNPPGRWVVIGVLRNREPEATSTTVEPWPSAEPAEPEQPADGSAG
jgi:sortase A